MSKSLKNLIIRAVKQSSTYNPDEALPFIEEDLNLGDFKVVDGFLSWVYTNGKTFGKGNIDQIFDEFMSNQMSFAK